MKPYFVYLAQAERVGVQTVRTYLVFALFFFFFVVDFVVNVFGVLDMVRVVQWIFCVCVCVTCSVAVGPVIN